MKHLKLLLVITLAAIPLMPIQAGHPGKCDMRTGTPCGKGSCVAYGKDGKPNGTYCRKECSNSCCKCEARCNGHHHDAEPSPEEEGQ